MNAANADLQAQLADVKHSLSFVNLQRHIAAVVRFDPATRALLEAFEYARQQFADLRQVIDFVTGCAGFSQVERLALLANPIDNGPPSKRRLAWECALKALETDASAELPK